VQNDVGWNLLTARLVSAPRPQTLEELVVYGNIRGSAGSCVGPLYRNGSTFGGGTVLSDRSSSSQGSVCGEIGSFVDLSEANVAAGARRDFLPVSEVPEEVLAAAGFEGDVSLDGSDLIVCRPRPALEAGGDRPAATLVDALVL
jgi:hypothetical protein